MEQKSQFRILADIARDLSSDKLTFPTFLDVTFRVRAALKDPDLSLDALTRMLGAEPLMLVKILRVANSAAFNPAGKTIVDLKSAIQRVGLDIVRNVAFAVAMEQLLQSRNMAPFVELSQRLWEHTVHVAALCRSLARRIARRVNPDEAMLAGLVHDIGVFYLLSRAANYPDLVADRAELLSLLQEWHCGIGHSLLTALGLPEAISEAVEKHEVDRAVPEIRSLADLLYVANRLAQVAVPWLDAPADRAQLVALFDATALEEAIAESGEEIQAIKASFLG